MIISFTDLQQDTVPRKIVIIQDSTRINPVSDSVVLPIQPKDTIKHKTTTISRITFPDLTDTTSVSTRNSIADVTFYNSDNFIFKIKQGPFMQFPFNNIEKVKERRTEERASLIKQLKSGDELPSNTYHPDWMIIIILFSAFLFSFVKTTTISLSGGFARFFLFMGTNDPIFHDKKDLFHWQSTVLNFISFLILGLFGYSAASYFNFIPAGSRGITVWLIVLGIICGAVTLRHFTCIIAGKVSGEKEAFREYLLGIYQSYRLGALVLFGIIILMSYTRIFPVRGLLITGIVFVALIYLLRVFRLFIIFLNKKLSIFYLILYLCALEILPVLIIIKYFTGTV